ncbi:MAG: right-handed parallel beta-helix repeat-containing protein [Deltaproteobacteria bacterium]|nr:right-handed parallel beta-helix repeat-containing protein [Deltaproteobacteria bacterium]
MKRLEILAALAFIGASTVAAPTWAAKLHVENWGTDSPTCGAMAAPCRSIGKAVALAVGGDTVMVGPGLYSTDLDGDSVLNEPGEEPSFGIVVSVPVTILSTHGASATRIETVSSASPPQLVNASGGAVFGKRNHGFTIVYAPTFCTPIAMALEIDGAGSAVAGNVVFVGCPFSTSFGILASDGAVVRDNRVAALSPSALTVGIDVDSLAERNVAIGALDGFNGWGKFRRNIAIENLRGFDLHSAPVAEFTKNIAVANTSYGIVIDSGATVTGPFSKNSIVNNDVTTNCGLSNQSGTAVLATNNFWGASTGPGADPADKVCDSGAGSSTTSTPFLTKPAAPGPGGIQ